MRVGYAEKSNSRFGLLVPSGSVFWDPDWDGDDEVNDDGGGGWEVEMVEVEVVVCSVGDCVSSLRRAMSSSRVQVS